MESKIDKLKRLYQELQSVVNNTPPVAESGPSVDEWVSNLNTIKLEISKAIESKVLPRFNQIDFNTSDEVEFLNYFFVGLSKHSIKLLNVLLEDEIYYFDKSEVNEVNLRKRKLLEARRESLDFEDELSSMICGDNSKFPYRTSWYLSKFFKENGFNYEHDGTTRSKWVSSVLKELNIQEIYSITEALFMRKYFYKHCQEKKLQYDKFVYDAQTVFSDFLENSIQSSKVINLSPAFKLNVNFELLSNKVIETRDSQFNEIIEMARRFYIEGNKQIAIEKLWDAFERLKTIIQPDDKKKSVNRLIKLIAGEIESIFFEDEFRSLTEIGNKYMIRHSEVGKTPIKNVQSVEYLFFRMLALIDFSISKLSLVDNK